MGLVRIRDRLTFVVDCEILQNQCNYLFGLELSFALFGQVDYNQSQLSISKYICLRKHFCGPFASLVPEFWAPTFAPLYHSCQPSLGSFLLAYHLILHSVGHVIPSLNDVSRTVGKL